MAKKIATYADYELRVEDNGKIVILNSGQVVQNAKSAIRTIASEVGFTLDPKWNTQSSGRKLVDFLNSSASASAHTPKTEATTVAAKSEPKQTTTPTPQSEVNKATAAKIKPKQAPVSTEKYDDKPVKNNIASTDIELTKEEMKQLDDILKRLESLEARIAKLEKAPANSQSNNTTREVITDHKYVGNSYTDYYLTSVGRILESGYAGWGHSRIGSDDFLLLLEQILIEIGEEDAIEIKDLTDATLKEAKDTNSDRYKKFMTQLTRLATKYGSKGTLPALLPNDALLFTDGWLRRTSVTKKAIKF